MEALRASLQAQEAVLSVLEQNVDYKFWCLDRCFDDVIDHIHALGVNANGNRNGGRFLPRGDLVIDLLLETMVVDSRSIKKKMIKKGGRFSTE